MWEDTPFGSDWGKVNPRFARGKKWNEALFWRQMRLASIPHHSAEQTLHSCQLPSMLHCTTCTQHLQPGKKIATGSNKKMGNFRGDGMREFPVLLRGFSNAHWNCVKITPDPCLPIYRCHPWAYQLYNLTCTKRVQPGKHRFWAMWKIRIKTMWEDCSLQGKNLRPFDPSVQHPCSELELGYCVDPSSFEPIALCMFRTL